MLELRNAPARSTAPRLQVYLVSTEEDLNAVQRLRWLVFARELGATLPGAAEIDSDRFDPYCDHLIVQDTLSGAAVGTYRILPPERAMLAGGLYSESEFDLSALSPLRPHMAEIGRACVHPDYRGGAVVTLLWAGLAQYLMQRGLRYLIGCGSIGLADGGVNAAAVVRHLQDNHAAPEALRAVPRQPWRYEAPDPATQPAIPSLIKGYLKVGAMVCGEPALDTQFNCADVLLLLSQDRIEGRYAKRFLAADGGAKSV